MQGIFAWELLVSIPFDLIGVNPESLPEKLYANFYKCADNSSLPHYLSWSPIETENPVFTDPNFLERYTLDDKTARCFNTSLFCLF